MRPLRPHETATGGASIHGCWNSIGVRGDKSCPELAVHAHCHNCPAYSSAAASLLNREIAGDPADDGDCQHHYALAATTASRDARSALLVRLGAEWFALPMLALDQVIESRGIHSLPHHRNPALLGLVNVRGELLICISLDRLLAVGAAATPGDGDARDQRMLVMRSGGGRVVFPVDEVEHHCRFHDEDVRPLPATARVSASSFATGLIEAEGRLAAIIDEDRLGQAVEGCLA